MRVLLEAILDIGNYCDEVLQRNNPSLVFMMASVSTSPLRTLRKCEDTNTLNQSQFESWWPGYIWYTSHERGALCALLASELHHNPAARDRHTVWVLCSKMPERRAGGRDSCEIIARRSTASRTQGWRHSFSRSRSSASKAARCRGCGSGPRQRDRMRSASPLA